MIACGFPHHAGATPRVAKALQQRLGFHAVVGLAVEPQRALEPVEHRTTEAQPLDALRRPIRRNLVAGHAPHLFGIGFEEDAEQLRAELVDRPILERTRLLLGKQLPARIARHAERRAPHAEIEQGLERAQRVGVEFALIIDAAHPRALDEIVRQDLVPQIDHFAALREESMTADVEAKTLVLDGTADPADIDRVLLDHRHALARLGQQIGSGEAGGAGADDGDIRPIRVMIHLAFPD